MNLNEKYKQQLLNSIPVVAAMNVDIQAVETNSITISAPLDTNINYEGTAFGGSLNTACVLSSYLLVHHFLNMNEVKFNSLVIQNSSVEYLVPVKKDFIAKSLIKQKNAEFLIRSISKRGKGRIEVDSVITTEDNSEVLVRFKGRFVVSK
jgi:thioesterase domain-containing protein